MLTIQQRQEGIHRSCFSALVADAGMSLSIPTPDMGIDLSIHEIVSQGNRRFESGWRVDVQLKCTTSAVLSANTIRYDITREAYDVLRNPAVVVPRLLVVGVLTPDTTRWTIPMPLETSFGVACYWLSLRGATESTNRTTVRLQIPSDNLVTPGLIRELFQRIRRGETV